MNTPPVISGIIFALVLSIQITHGDEMRVFGFICVIISACTTTEKQTVDEVCVDASVDGHELLYQGRAYSDMEGDSLIIDNEEDWLFFQEGVSFPTTTDTLVRNDIDWTQEQVIVASAFVPSTCGLYTQIADSCIKEDVSFVQLVVDDFSGNCEGVCQTEDQVLLIVAAPIGEVNVQTTIIPTCKEEG